MSFEIRIKDIDPDTGKTNQDVRICTSGDETFAKWIKSSLEKDWCPSDPNREFYIKEVEVREYTSEIIEELIEEIDESESEKFQRELNYFATWVLKHYSTDDKDGFCYVNSMGEYTPTPEVIEHYLRQR